MRHLKALLILSAIALATSACGRLGSGGTSQERGALAKSPAPAAQLTAEQCTFFAAAGKVQICHHTSSAKNPYTIIKTDDSGCINGHSTHADDYVAVGDPTCKGLGCYPAGAPFDGTVECCEGLAPDASGHCASLVNCATAAAGTACMDGVATTIGDACDGAGACAGHACSGASCIGDGSSASAPAGALVSLGGVSFTVPAGNAGLFSITSTTITPPTSASNGADIVAASPVFEFGPHGAVFGSPLAVTFNAGALQGAIVYWSHDGVSFDPLPANASTGLITVAVNGFSYAVLSQTCGGRAAGTPCGKFLGVCAIAPTCQLVWRDSSGKIVLVAGPPATSTMNCVLPYLAAGTPCGAKPTQCQSYSCTGSAAACSATVVNLADGTSCSDGNACTQIDACRSGTCTGGNPVTCFAAGQCFTAGTCAPTSGVCSNPYAASGTACNDLNASTINDVCNGSGVCAGVAGVASSDFEWSLWPAPPDVPVSSVYAISADGLTVRDTQTQLTWTRTAFLPTISAAVDCDNLTLGGFSDWRLPTVIEISALANFNDSASGSPTGFDTVAFTDTVPKWFFTSSVVASSVALAAVGSPYAVYWGQARVGNGGTFVRCVRPGVKALGLPAGAPAGRYTLTADTVLDTVTGLTWERNASTTGYGWTAAQSHCQGLTIGGSGWRMPAVKELESIVDIRAPGATIDAAAFPGTQLTSYWTGYRSQRAIGYASVLRFFSGEPWGEDMTSLFPVRCVK